MRTHLRDRRAWWSLVAAVASAGLVTAAEPVPAGCTGFASKAVIAADGEPGTPLTVSGTVFLADGVTPAPGLTVYVYQTDAGGLYNRTDGQPPRLRAWLTTDSAGRFELRTIRPGPYPGRRIAAHIHFQTWGAGHEPQWHEELQFEDDPSVDARQKERSRGAGRFAFVHAPQPGPDGRPRVTHDIRLKPSGDRFEDSIRHGLRDCAAATRS